MKRYIRNAASYIVGMSKSKEDLADWIEDQTMPTLVALAQLYVFPYGARTHWRREVWEKFHTMHVFRHSKKFPDPAFILSNSWKCNNSQKDLNDVIGFVIGKEVDYTPRQDIDIDVFYNIAESYFIWLSNELSNTKLLRPEKVYDKLDELGLREHL